MLADSEQKLLDIISKHHLVRKTEILQMKELGGEGMEAANALVSKGMIKIVHPVGETSFAITLRGLKFLKGEE